jgi:hypothetical protein
MMQEAVARFLVSQGKNIVDRPGWPGTRSEVEFYAVFVMVEPGIEQERLQSHASTSKQS